jgi:hypothetical protein
MCAKHWRMVPKKIQERVWAHYREGQGIGTASPQWKKAADAAIRAVAEHEGKQLGLNLDIARADEPEPEE